MSTVHSLSNSIRVLHPNRYGKHIVYRKQRNGKRTNVCDSIVATFKPLNKQRPKKDPIYRQKSVRKTENSDNRQ